MHEFCEFAEFYLDELPAEMIADCDCLPETGCCSDCPYCVKV